MVRCTPSSLRFRFRFGLRFGLFAITCENKYGSVIQSRSYRKQHTDGTVTTNVRHMKKNTCTSKRNDVWQPMQCKLMQSNASQIRQHQAKLNKACKAKAYKLKHCRAKYSNNVHWSRTCAVLQGLQR